MSQLTQSVMLANLSMGRFVPRKFDRSVSNDIAAKARSQGANGESGSMGRYNKILISKSAFRRVDRAYGQLRNFHYQATMPFLDSGARVLVNTMFGSYDNRVQSMFIEIDDLVSEALTGWDYWVGEARDRLGPLFNDTDYPSVHEVRDCFYHRIAYSPMPEAGHWISRIEGPVLERLKRETETRERQIIGVMLQDIWRRMFDAVAHMHERLEGFAVDSDGSVDGKIFKDSLVKNLRELVKVLPDLNVVHDPEIDRMTRKISRGLATFDPETLRHDPIARTQAVAAARAAKDEIADAMRAVM